MALRGSGPFDTAAMSRILGVPVEQIRKELDKASIFLAAALRCCSSNCPKRSRCGSTNAIFLDFHCLPDRRSYPTKIAGNLLVYVGEVDDRIIERNSYYRSGDYIGRSGIELAYEDVLRGKRA